VILAQNSAKKKLIGVEEKLSHLNKRLDLNEYLKKMKKMPTSKWDDHVRGTIEKFSLIDSLEDVRDNIENYDELVSKLSNQDLYDVKKSIAKVRHQVLLMKKYGLEIGSKLINHQYFLGMTIEQLVDCKGNPTKIEQEVLKTKTKTIYIYGNKSSGDVFVFVDGELERFKDR
jgi:hypothetical protein